MIINKCLQQYYYIKMKRFQYKISQTQPNTIRKIYEEKNIKTKFQIQDIKQIFNEYFKIQINDDFIIEHALDEFVKDKQEDITFNIFSDIIYYIKCKAEQNKSTRVFGLFIFNSLLTLRNGKLSIENQYCIPKKNFEMPYQLKQFLQPENVKKQDAFVGRIAEMQTQPEDYYIYNQHVACKVPDFDVKQKFIEKQRLFARAIWNFDFYQALQFSNEIKDKFPNEIVIIKYLLEEFKEINDLIKKDKELRNYFWCRKTFEMNGIQNQNGLIKKSSTDLDKQKGIKLPFKIHSIKSKFDMMVNLCENLCLNLKTKEVKQQDKISMQYLKSILIFLGNKKDRANQPYDEITLNEKISLKDRFNFAKKYLSPTWFSQFKINITKEVQTNNSLQNIPIFGKGKQTQMILQNYLDITLDIQLVAFLSIYFKTFKFSQNSNPTYELFIKVYKRFLEKQGNDNARIQFQKKIDQVEKLYNGKVQSGFPKFILKCSKCSSSLAHKSLLKAIDPKKQKIYNRFIKDQRKRFNQCTQCQQLLNRCCICLMLITIKNPYSQYDPRRVGKSPAIDEGIDETQAIIWCQSCKHGGHFNHLMHWFNNESRCPVKNCNCICEQN